MDTLSTSRFRTGLGDVGSTSKGLARGSLGLRRATGWFEAGDGFGSGWLRCLERGGRDARNRAGFDGFQGNARGLGGHVFLVLTGGPLAFGRGIEGWVDILRVDVFQGLSLARDGSTWMIRRVRSMCNTGYRADHNRHTTLFVLEVHARLGQRTQTRGVESSKRLARGGHSDSRHDCML